MGTRIRRIKILPLLAAAAVVVWFNRNDLTDANLARMLADWLTLFAGWAVYHLAAGDWFEAGVVEDD